jgi:ketosteroid isomerase-like protein
MSGSSTDVEIIERMYAAMATRDVATLFELIHPECVITQDDRLPWGGRHVGQQGFMTFALSLTGAIESKVTHLAVFEANGCVYQFGRTRGTAKATGNEFDIPEAHTWTLRDGQVVNVHFAIDTTAMLNALGLAKD